PELVEGAAEQRARVHADHAAVAHDQHVLAVRMGGGDALDGGAHAPAPHRPRLTARRRTVVRRAQPGAVGVALARAHLVHRAALPFAQRQLAQLVHYPRGPAIAPPTTPPPTRAPR